MDLNRTIEDIIFSEEENALFTKLCIKHFAFLNKEIKEFPLVGKNRLIYIYLNSRLKWSLSKYNIEYKHIKIFESFNTRDILLIEDSNNYIQLLEEILLLYYENKFTYYELPKYHIPIETYNGIIKSINSTIPIAHIEYIKNDNDYNPLTTFESIKFSLNGMFKGIINEDKLFCLINDRIGDTLTLKKICNNFYNERINEKDYLKTHIFIHIPTINEIIREIDTYLFAIKNYSAKDIHDTFIKNHYTPLINEIDIKLDKINSEIETNFWNDTQQKYFFFQLTTKNKKNIFKKKTDHQFVNSNIQDFEDSEFGYKAELALYRYLIKEFEKKLWYNELTASFINPSNCIIEWNNKDNESFQPYDFKIELEKSYKIEVKATRSNDDKTIFFVSINELKEMLKAPNLYIIARLFLIPFDKEVSLIEINNTFGAEFYQFSDNAIKIIKENLDEWENFNNENKIQFTLSHLKPIKNNYDINTNTPPFLKQKDIQIIKKDKEFEKYINKFIFEDLTVTIENLINYFKNNKDIMIIFNDKLNQTKELKSLKMQEFKKLHKRIIDI